VAERLAVTFDFWETLVRDTPDGLARARAARLVCLAGVLRRAGHPCPTPAVEEAYERCGAEMSSRFWTAHRDCSVEEQVRLFFECLDPGVLVRLEGALFEEAVAGYGEAILRWPPRLLPGAAEAVRRLAERGVPLGIVSNTGRTPGRVLRRVLDLHGLRGCFGAMSFSDEVGARKPASAIFLATLRGLGATAGAAWHVGDNPGADVAGARATGMRAVHFAADGNAPSAEADLVVRDLSDLPGLLPLRGAS